MNRSGFATLMIAGLLATFPLALKLGVYKTLARVDTSRETRVLSFMAEQGFKTVKDQSPDPQFFLIHASRDLCKMDLREVAPRGYDRVAIQTISAGRRLFYVDNGDVSAEQPTWRTWSYLHFRRFAGFLGWPLARRLTFAVIQNSSCAYLDWSKLSKRTDADAAIAHNN